MTHKTHLTRCATIAIAATLALPSTTLLAQDVAAPPAPAPVIIVPTVQAPPPPVAAPAAPTIVIPDVSAVEEPAAAPRAAQPARTTPRAAAATPVRAAPRPAPAAEPIPPETTITETAPVEVAPIAAAPAEPILAPEPAPVAESTGLDDATIFGLGAVGILGLIAVLFAATRRRRPKTSPEAEAPRIERPIVQRDPIAAVPAGTAAPEFATGVEPQPSVSYAPATFGAVRPTPSASLSHSGAAVALPREMPKTFEEREALMQRMIAAKPDRANPFRSTRARAKRARMILASLGRDFSNTEPWIDLSQYPSNWPEVARRHSAAA